MKRMILLLLAAVMALSLLPALVLAAVFNGKEGHWAESSIDACDAMGLFDGLAGAQYSPDENATRGDMYKMMDNIMRYPDVSGKSFADLAESHPHYRTILNMAAAGIIDGYEDGTVRADNAITREEAVVIFGRVFGVAPDVSAYREYNDSAEIGVWARPLVGGMKTHGFNHGYEDGSFRPKDSITMAELARMTDNMLTGLISRPGTYEENFGPGCTVVNSAGVTLNNTVIAGTLVAAPGIGGGELILDSVKAGRVLIIGGMETIIIREGSEIDNVTMAAGGSALTIEESAAVSLLEISGGHNKVDVAGIIASAVVYGSDSVISGSGSITGTVEYVSGERNEITVSGAQVIVGDNSGAVQAGGTTIQPGSDNLGENGQDINGGGASGPGGQNTGAARPRPTRGYVFLTNADSTFHEAIDGTPVYGFDVWTPDSHNTIIRTRQIIEISDGFRLDAAGVGLYDCSINVNGLATVAPAPGNFGFDADGIENSLVTYADRGIIIYNGMNAASPRNMGGSGPANRGPVQIGPATQFYRVTMAPDNLSGQVHPYEQQFLQYNIAAIDTANPHTQILLLGILPGAVAQDPAVAVFFYERAVPGF